MTAARRSLSQRVLWLAIVVFAVAWLWTAITAGDELPARIDGSGTVTRWDSKWSFLTVVGLVGGFTSAFFAGWRYLVRRVPGHMINLPDLEAWNHWISPENRPRFDRMIAEDLEWIGVATVALLAWITVVAGSVDGDDVGLWTMGLPTGAYTVGIIVYSMVMIFGTRYRIPT